MVTEACNLYTNLENIIHTGIGQTGTVKLRLHLILFLFFLHLHRRQFGKRVGMAASCRQESYRVYDTILKYNYLHKISASLPTSRKNVRSSSSPASHQQHFLTFSKNSIFGSMQEPFLQGHSDLSFPKNHRERKGHCSPGSGSLNLLTDLTKA